MTERPARGDSTLRQRRRSFESHESSPFIFHPAWPLAPRHRSFMGRNGGSPFRPVTSIAAIRWSSFRARPCTATSCRRYWCVRFRWKRQGAGCLWSPCSRKARARLTRLPRPSCLTPSGAKDGAVLKVSAESGGVPILHYQTEAGPVPRASLRIQAWRAYPSGLQPRAESVVTGNHPPDHPAPRRLFRLDQNGVRRAASGFLEHGQGGRESLHRRGPLRRAGADVERAGPGRILEPSTGSSITPAARRRTC